MTQYISKLTNDNYARDANYSYFLELNEDKLNATKTNEKGIVHSSDQEQGMNYGLTFFVTGVIILILGILTLIIISKIF